MKNSLFLLIIFALISCHKQKNRGEATQNPKAQVKISSIITGNLPNNLELTGKTRYLNKNTLIAPIDGYIVKVNAKEGEQVSKGKILFEMQSPEAYVMQQNDSLKTNYGIVKITSPVWGVLTDLKIMQKNVFINQAAELCLITDSKTPQVEVKLAYMYRKYAKVGQKCQIILPDNRHIAAKFSKILPKMEEENQSMRILANFKSSIFIPENMIVKVIIKQFEHKKTQILPKKCLMNDALMTKYWVMKLINDSTAVKIPVQIGNQTHKQVEIITPQFKTNDKIISEGAYGLTDSALVEVL